MVEIFHILLGTMIAVCGGAAYLYATQEADDDTISPSRHSPRLSLVASRDISHMDDARSATRVG